MRWNPPSLRRPRRKHGNSPSSSRALRLPDAMDTTSLLLQMVAARMGNDANPTTAQLLAQLGVNKDGPAPDMQAILNGLGDQNPAAQLLARHLEELQASRQKVAEAPAGPPLATVLEL